MSLGGKTLLNDFDISFASGELTALLGSNGAGKSTLLKALYGEGDTGATSSSSASSEQN
ncbi:ATP-binding cassette domain-containing protein [Photobacterium alginatilyticum]|uniref:ATP-binding cassette domain-containing protein n=1 Tax=Photobacterium alginatilyticum TaxID=1775171 RepID=UPI0040689438